MKQGWTFGRKLGAGFFVMAVLAVAISVISIVALRSVVATYDRVIAVNARNLLDMREMYTNMERMVASSRGYLLLSEDVSLDRLREAQEQFKAIVDQLRSRIDDEASRRLIDEIIQRQANWRAAMDRIIAQRTSGVPLDEIGRRLGEDALPLRNAVDERLAVLIASEEDRMARAQQSASEASSSAIALLVVIVTIAAVVAALIAFLLTRQLLRQIGTAVQHVQNSTTELQSAANQQAAGARQQATAMNEITTTISELLASSRQIAESAQRVAQLAGQTATAARGGDDTVQKGQDAVGGIKRQVDLIVGHMLELGKKAQQIGGILELINELAEQTNILAINATIEAAGAGEAGKRFAVVAEEIRRLADRVASTTKEIHVLIDETRAAANTTVMATETGAKAVDFGLKQFGGVASSFGEIATLVKTTTEAAREIELSTKQQTTAVEQVNVAIADVAQSTKESEASSNQTLQTATMLTGLARDLSQFVQSRAAA